MRVTPRLHLIAAVLGFTLIAPAQLTAQDSRRDREERLREDRIREERLRESRLREDLIDRVREERLRADRRRDDHLRDFDIGEAVRERVEAAMRRSHEALDRAEFNRFRAEDFSRLGVDVQERVREALRDYEGRSLDRDHALRMSQEAREHALRSTLEAQERIRDVDVNRRVREALERAGQAEGVRRGLHENDWSTLESRRLGDEIRERVRESLERSEALRERNIERALEEQRRSQVRRDRIWY